MDFERLKQVLSQAFVRFEGHASLRILNERFHVLTQELKHRVQDSVKLFESVVLVGEVLISDAGSLLSYRENVSPYMRFLHLMLLRLRWSHRSTGRVLELRQRVFAVNHVKEGILASRLCILRRLFFLTDFVWHGG